MVFSGMLRRVALVRTDDSEELTRATRRNIPEDTILHSHRRENLKSFILFSALCIPLPRNRLSYDLSYPRNRPCGVP
jgi:hypothetical protein